MTDRWAELVYQSKAKCAGCRDSWSLYRKNMMPTGAREYHLGQTKCEALELRRQIRALTPASG